ncbi:hypothetical protein BDR06DRAFT_1006524 [Suillus hirtellus]|nr:hypothetical protein BDR06DRAFT_1006524 [Suillus hirtellus]
MELEGLSTDMEEDTGMMDEVDNDDSFVDKNKLLDKKEWAALNKEIRPVKLALVKVCKLTYKTIYLTTIILSAWHAILKDCWNSKPSYHMTWPHGGI